MRRYLVIFMLFLLPLRGLVGDAMAYSMLPAGVPVQNQSTHILAMQNATNSVAINVQNTWASITIEHQNPSQSAANPPCHMDMAAAGDADASASQCTTCQVCHLCASIPMQLQSGMLHTSKAVPAQRAAHWVSADPRLLAKTPVL